MKVHEISGTPVRLTASRAHNTVGHVRRISVVRGFFALCFAAALAVPAVAADKDPWTIRIIPARRFALAQAKPAPVPQEPSVVPGPRAAQPRAQASSGPRIIPGRSFSAMSGGPSYADVYRSIPFSWAEYAANPSYRSQAALGLMLGQMPYPSSGASQVPQYGYVTPYQWDRTYGTPNSANLFYELPLFNW